MTTRNAFLRTYNVAPDHVLDLSISLNGGQLIKDQEVLIPNWLPGIQLTVAYDLVIDFPSLAKSCFLRSTDTVQFVFVVDSRKTHRSFIFAVPLKTTGSQIAHQDEFEIESESVGGSLKISGFLIVDPDLSLNRKLGSPSTAKCVVLEREWFAIVQRGGALATLVSEDLGLAFWRFDLDLPEDPQEWVSAEWNEVVRLVVDTAKARQISESAELKSLMTSELVMQVLAKVFDTEGGLELVATAVRPGTFILEVQKWLALTMNFKKEGIDAARREWISRHGDIHLKSQQVPMRKFSKQK